jgi:hypothetical protein
MYFFERKNNLEIIYKIKQQENRIRKFMSLNKF